jgi:hypothetical protein
MYRLVVVVLFASIGLGFSACAAKKKTSLPAEPKTSAPKVVVDDFFELIRRGQPQEANKLIAKFPGLPGNVMVPLMMSMASKSKGKTRRWTAMTNKTNGDVAVVVLLESREKEKPAFAIDPVYLFRQRGKWRILPKLTRFDLSYFHFSKQQLKDYRKLELWFEDGKSNLMQELAASS